MGYEWVIGTYTGKKAKEVKALADSGVGYFIQQESGKAEQYGVRAAFRRVVDGPRPFHLEAANLMQTQKLEDLYLQRHEALRPR